MQQVLGLSVVSKLLERSHCGLRLVTALLRHTKNDWVGAGGSSRTCTTATMIFLTTWTWKKNLIAIINRLTVRAEGLWRQHDFVIKKGTNLPYLFPAWCSRTRLHRWSATSSHSWTEQQGQELSIQQTWQLPLDISWLVDCYKGYRPVPCCWRTSEEVASSRLNCLNLPWQLLFPVLHQPDTVSEPRWASLLLQ